MTHDLFSLVKMSAMKMMYLDAPIFFMLSDDDPFIVLQSNFNMMSAWIFVMKGKEEEFLARLKTEKWPIYQRTPNRTSLAKGGSVIFYLAGVRNMKFMGTATLSSEVEVEGDDFSVGISNVNVWKKPVLVKSILESLNFVPNDKRWGSYFQGGVLWISKEDYNTILRSRVK